MTKTPGEIEQPRPITKAERDARKAFRQVDAEKAVTEHEIAQKAFSANLPASSSRTLFAFAGHCTTQRASARK
jgi:hypothetical protein